MEVTEKNIACFLASSCRSDLACALNGKPGNLAYNLFVCPVSERYRQFTIPKKSGGLRVICAPSSGIRYYQRNIADLLSFLYDRKSCVHGFVTGRSIKTNAAKHCNRRWIVNIDLHDFFPTIHFGRVRGLFMAPPFGFNEQTAATLAQICCHEGRLPQGAPSSPVISNFICRALDNSLHDFAVRNRLTYTRYADDITFSTNLREIPPALGTIDSGCLFFLSDEVRDLITSNGFRINEAKLRFAARDNRQDVTGLVVNKKVNVRRNYIRRIRAMIHAWEKYGLEAAAQDYFGRYHPEKTVPAYPGLAYERILAGMIGFVGQIRGVNDALYGKLYSRLKHMDKTVRLAMPTCVQNMAPDSVLILCEGKTDGVHLKAALDFFVRQGDFTDLKVYFMPYPEQADPNNGDLAKFCSTAKINPDQRFMICLFDNDDNRFRYGDSEHPYKYWGNNVYSCNLPQPEHRDFREVCIEFFYTDEVLTRKDDHRRRIFVSSEFDRTTACHKTEELFCRVPNSLKANYPKILDCGVNNAKGENVAMSKNEFAQNIARRKGRFAQVDFRYFRSVFERFQLIIKDHDSRGGCKDKSQRF